MAVACVRALFERGVFSLVCPFALRVRVFSFVLWWLTLVNLFIHARNDDHRNPPNPPGAGSTAAGDGESRDGGGTALGASRRCWRSRRAVRTHYSSSHRCYTLMITVYLYTHKADPPPPTPPHHDINHPYLSIRYPPLYMYRRRALGRH